MMGNGERAFFNGSRRGVLHFTFALLLRHFLPKPDPTDQMACAAASGSRDRERGMCACDRAKRAERNEA